MEHYNLTNAQKRIIYTEEIYCEPRISNEGGFYKISTPFNLYKLLDAVVAVLNSSKIFRTTFLLKNDEIIQKYRDCKFDHSIVNIFFDKNEFENYKRVCLNSKFDIYNDFLFKFGVYQNEDGGQLFVMFHHSIVDAYSIGLIAGAIFDIYNGHEFNIGTEYIEYLQEEQRYFEDTEKINEDKVYWENRLYNCENSFESIPENPSSEKILIRLDDNYLERWELFLKKNHLNENIFLITLLCIYKYRIADEKNGILGVPYYNRRNKRFYNSFGMFTSTVPFSYSLSGEESIIDTYKKIKRNFLKDIKHSGYPYNELINNLKANGKNLFEWSFNYYVDNMNYLV
ncbi:condensation domain-containing protein [Streptococcus agalactiae]|uniref:condensation domain-containing protein n=1 Tax=Streptococcus agalactiae TaxID=1311 RepID=UPI002005B61B|nr:condensation domain-containing protein [Streptococcus agalactiae]MCK6357195.1 condensation domain-containing protein [Streptococcus agalactiae]